MQICKEADGDIIVLLLQADTRNQGWWFWPEPIRKREPAALAAATQLHKDDIERFIALQFLFDRQWKAVKVQLFINVAVTMVLTLFM